ncbi:MAG: hypothetical protein K9N38_03620 [Candidatus Marinimicrobia bacterium]|nr:hypothetical protein [Candidatus Neomarinimicrobiota bacterium]MCF7850490.1 hypothetical protein [Candidatus Neomarinimicrobiota bacterium]
MLSKVANALSQYPWLKQVLKRVFFLPGALISFYLPRYRSAEQEVILFSEKRNDCFFGYYDQTPFGERGAVIFHRSSDPGSVEIIHARSGHFSKLGESTTWNLQQGARLAWLMKNVVIYNVEEGGLLRAKVQPKDSEGRLLNSPMAALSADAQKIVGCDFAAISRLNPEYGYLVDGKIPDQNHYGAFWVEDVNNGDISHTVNLEQVLDCVPRSAFRDAEHELNHFSFSPDGQTLAFVHRWYGLSGSRNSRLLAFDLRNGMLLNLLDNGMVSHYCWTENSSLFIYGNHSRGKSGFCTLSVNGGACHVNIHESLSSFGDGHPSYNSKTGLIVFDSYPDWKRYQYLYLYSPEKDAVSEIGRFRSPLRFFGPRRCDLHPRWDEPGERIAIDVCFNNKRELMNLNVSKRVSMF